MRLRMIRTITGYSFVLLACIFVLPTISYASSTGSYPTSRPITTPTASPTGTTKLADFPTVDPNYIYDQLFTMATQFQRREAGYDTNLPVSVNAHDEFADYWAKEISQDLQGFGPQIRRDEFPVAGWLNRPAKVPAFNVEVSVPGATHPEQVVVIGCHYDGEASSTQSANDDASGCAIELGVAKAMGNFWRTHHVYPARTLRFVIFDAEEQGLFGSFHYLNSTVNGDVHNIVAMFNEEQSGIAYPLRFLGQLKNPLLPFYIDMSPLTNSQLYPAQNQLSPTQRNAITRFRTLMAQAVPAAFQQFQALGYLGLTYHADNGQDSAQPIFTPDQLTNIHQEDDTLGGSDQIPFTLAGLPCATFAGNSTYYDNNPPPESYPFDQKEDTIQLMNTFADGSSHKSNALMLALALPGMLTSWMLNQQDILGQTSLVDQAPLASISDIGQAQVGTNLTVDARASYDPQGNSSLSYAWDFGDGSKASGVTATHSYASAGSYTLTLTVSSATGKRQVSKTITVVPQTTVYRNPYSQQPQDGIPPSNPQVTLPVANDSLSDKVINTSVAATSSPTTGATTPGTAFSPTPLIFIAVLILIISGAVVFFMLRKRNQGIAPKPKP
ncbi:MAG TPA: M28 family peptidase [Ktedonobacteraceae bacterium]|nr:M28 family peptidase [Ktedonobacteraceae bacterium]